MVMDKRLIISLFVLFVFVMLQAKDTISIVRIENKDLFLILDSIIEHEKKCNYYSPDLVFEILLRRVNGIIDIQIETGGKNKYKMGYEQGLFQYCGHTFFLCGIFDDTIFSYTGDKIAYVFEEINDVVDPETGEMIITIYEDDSYTVWIYKYENNKFLYQNEIISTI